MTAISLIVLILSALATIGLVCVALKAIMACVEATATVLLLFIMLNLLIYMPLCGFVPWNGSQTEIIIPEKISFVPSLIKITSSSDFI